jgi:hypothetical protein
MITVHSGRFRTIGMTILLSCAAIWGVTSGLACDRPPAPRRASSAKTAKPVEPAAPKASPSAAQSVVSTPASGSANPVASAPAAEPKDLRNGIMAYYFHRTLRCKTCLSIEGQAKVAIEAGFAGELANGLIAWRAVNIEAPGDEHFQQDFEIDRQTLMFVEMRDGRAVRSTKLERVWDLVEDPGSFQEYVSSEMRSFLDAG